MFRNRVFGYIAVGVHKVADAAYIAAMIGDGVYSWAEEAVRTVFHKKEDSFPIDCAEEFEMVPIKTLPRPGMQRRR